MEKQKKIKAVRRKYDEGFKSEALRMVNGGRSVPDVARSLGMSENLLYNGARSKSRRRRSGRCTTTSRDMLHAIPCCRRRR